MRTKLIAALLLFTSLSANAGRVNVTTTIDALYTYAEQAGFDGDVAIKIASPPAGCEGGFGLRSADSRGYKNAIAFLVSALHTGARIHLSGLDDEIWSGSGTRYCRLDQLSLAK